MMIKKLHSCLLMIFLALFIFGTTVSSYASLQREDEVNQNSSEYEEEKKANKTDDQLKSSMNDTGESPDLLQWNLEVDDNTFQVTVNRSKEIITIRGEAENWEQKQKVEHVLKLRAPTGFQIINEIDISRPSIRQRG